MKNFVLLLPFTLLALGACDQVAPTGSEVASDVQALSADEAPERAQRAARPRPPHRHGPHELLHIARHELDDLDDAQRSAIEAALPSPPQRPQRADRSALADAVRSGDVDGLAPPPGPDHEAMREQLAAALQTLHGTLTSKQRQAVASIAEERRARGPRGDHEAKRPRKPYGSPGDRLLQGIELTDQQRSDIDDALAEAGFVPPSAEEMRAHHEARRAADEALLDAFEGDAFDAAAFFEQLPEPAARPPHPAVMLAAIVPHLDAEQRAVVATRLERGPRGGQAPGPGLHDRQRR